ncbi:MAG TPA: oligoendopeptidase F, partial [Deinococcales bacterium]|nr:oligoendopeptidase F [Deinococcales bacterium]
MSSVKTLPERTDIDDRYKWNAESVFATVEDWQREFEATSARVPELARHQGRLGESAGSLLAWFHDSEAVRRSLGRLNVYAGMSAAVDARDQAATARQAMVGGLAARVAAATAFAQPELLALGRGRVEQLLASDERLGAYRHYFERLERAREHVRSAEVEELLGAVQDPFRTAAQSHG